jgi:hypothetical protein
MLSTNSMKEALKMTSPRPSDESVIVTSTAPSSSWPAAPTPLSSRLPALLGIVGGALGIAGYFLPWYFNGTSGAPDTPAYNVTYSGWNVINQYLTGAPLPGTPPSGQPIPTLPYFALLIGVPLLTAVVALVIAGMGVLRRGMGPVLAGLLATAGIMGLLGGGTSSGLSILTIAGGAGSTSPPPSTVGMGLVVVQLGYFGILAGGIVGVIQARRATA